MTDDLLLGPLLPRGAVTTLTGPRGRELATLTAAIVVSLASGLEVLPGLRPSLPTMLRLYAYGGPTWLEWTSMVQDVADEAQIAAPVIDIEVRSTPHVQAQAAARERKRDPDAESFWEAYVDADMAVEAASAKEAGLQPAPFVAIIFGVAAAAGSGGSGAISELYRSLEREGSTALLVDNDGALPICPPTFGPILGLSTLRSHVCGLGAFLDRAVDRGAWGDVAAFLHRHGIEAVRALHADRTSVESQRLKAQAHALGITPGRLWYAAEHVARDATRRSEPTDSGPGVLHGYGTVWGQWREVNSTQGNFLESMAPGCCARTIAESRDRIKSTFQHGQDSRFGDKPLGPITVLEEDDRGLHYEVELLDRDYVWELVPWLRTGLFGSSITFEVRAADFVRNPGRSAHNPRGIPERTICELRLQELGPVHPPAYSGTSAAIRSNT